MTACKYFVQGSNDVSTGTLEDYDLIATFRYRVDAIKYARSIINYNYVFVRVGFTEKVIWYCDQLSLYELNSMGFVLKADDRYYVEPEDWISDPETEYVMVTENQEGTIDNPIIIED